MKRCIILIYVLAGLYIPPVFSKNFILRSYSDDSLQVIEKVYLHVDRNIYYPGDNIWFKAYLVEAMDHMLTNHSSNLHVELISPALKIISSRIIRLDGGSGNGDFKVPDDVSPGRYRIRAYTNYMRNFSDQLFFTKEITVISGDEQNKIPDDIKRVKNSITLDFFPEGGSLIDNVSSFVAFKAVDSQGKGCNISGRIYSSAGNLITTFKSTHLGMGSFLLRPIQGLKYYSVYKGPDSTERRTELPLSFRRGITLSVTRNQEKELVINTATNPETFELVSNLNMLLSLSIRNEVVDTITFRFKSPVTSFTIPTLSLPDGILKLTLTAPRDLPLSERLVYTENEAPLKISIETDKRVYKKREPVNLRVSIPEDSIIERSNISLAVVNNDFINNASPLPRSISSWFLLESDIKGIVEDPSYYFDPSEPDRLKNLDLLLLTQGWRDFAWKYDTTYFPPEDGFTVSGILRKDNKNKPIVDSRISIGIFGSGNTLMRTVPVDSAGKFKLSGVDLTGEATLIVSGIDKKDKLDGLVSLDSIKYIPAKVADNLLDIVTLRKTVLDNLKSNYTINETIKKKYKLTDTILLGEVNITAERKDFQTVKVESSRLKYGKPDAELKVTEHDYGFVKVLNLLKGTIPGVVVPPGDTTVLIRGIGSLSFMLRPLVLIDGRPVSFEEFADTPIFLIDRIDVLKSVASTTIYGFQGFSGVINLITKANFRREDLRPDNSSARIKISGYDAPRIFYSPQHLSDSVSAFKPDLRNTLYWNPDINLEGNKEIILNYYNGDNASRIKVISEGITTTGIPVTGKTEYEVK
jgi:hypothetical protein